MLDNPATAVDDDNGEQIEDFDPRAEYDDAPGEEKLPALGDLGEPEDEGGNEANEGSFIDENEDAGHALPDDPYAESNGDASGIV